MSKKVVLSGVTLGFLVCVYWLVAAEDPKDSGLNNASLSNTHLQSEQSTVEPNSPSTTSDTNQSASDLPHVEDSAITDNIAAQMEDALLQYEEISKYPPHSQPIQSEQHIHSFVNTNLPQASHPFPFDDLATPIQLSIALDQINYFFGDPIQAEITIADTPAQASLSARAVLMDLEGKVLAESGNAEIFDARANISFDTAAYANDNWPMEMNFGAYIDVNGYNLFISAPFRINSASAELDSVGFSEPVAENLIIPINLNVKTPGYYYVAGILYSQTTTKPLIHLEAEGPLDEGLATLKLKAHIQALKHGADEGPYYIDNIRVERWSDERIPHDVAGKVPAANYPVEGYAFNDYQDVPYLDPLAEERKRLMQGFSSH